MYSICSYLYWLWWSLNIYILICSYESFSMHSLWQPSVNCILDHVVSQPHPHHCLSIPFSIHPLLVFCSLTLEEDVTYSKDYLESTHERNSPVSVVFLQKSVATCTCRCVFHTWFLFQYCLPSLRGSLCICLCPATRERDCSITVEGERKLSQIADGKRESVL